MRRQGGYPKGKLEALARQWASGRSASKETDEFDDECVKFGIDPAALRWGSDRPAGRVQIWPDMQDAVALFFALSTQWRWTGVGMAGAFRTGLDYSVLEATAKATGLELTAALFDDIRTLEREALAVWSRKRG
jgi:hypothetical protein